MTNISFFLYQYLNDLLYFHEMSSKGEEKKERLRDFFGGRLLMNKKRLCIHSTNRTGDRKAC